MVCGRTDIALYYIGLRRVPENRLAQAGFVHGVVPADHVCTVLGDYSIIRTPISDTAIVSAHAERIAGQHRIADIL